MPFYEETGPDTRVLIVKRDLPEGYSLCGHVHTVHYWGPEPEAFKTFCAPLTEALEAQLGEGKRLVAVQARVEFTYTWAEKRGQSR